VSRPQSAGHQSTALFASVPKYLQDALEQREHLIFAGAGISRTYRDQPGLPTAADLAVSIERELLGRTPSAGPLSLSQVSQEAIWADGSRQRLNNFLRKTFATAPITPKPAHVAIATLGGPVITTNYDTLIERASIEVGTPLSAVWRDDAVRSVNAEMRNRPIWPCAAGEDAPQSRYGVYKMTLSDGTVVSLPVTGRTGCVS
jgi:hypothetical protein